ncbi:MFS transporter [Rubrobacter tropicus]|nr:MFS transporter [Rubrobacter tropicus]
MSVRGSALLSPLKGTAFRRLWAGASLSMLADQAFLVSLTWLVLRITESGASLGVVLAVASVPGIVLTPLGGVLSDKLSPVVVMSSASIVRAVLMGLLALLVLTDAVRIWHVYLLAGGLSALDALYYPASMSVVPTLVDRDRLKAANALTQGVEQISSILGPALAGLVLALFGLWINLGANAVLFLISAAIFAALARTVAPGARTFDGGETGGAEDGANTLSALAEGVRYAWGDPVIRTIMLVLVGINLAMAGPIYVGGSLLSEARLGGAGAFGTLLAVGGVGSLIGAMTAGSIERLRRRGIVELVSTAVMGAGVGALAFAPNLAVACFLAASIGMTASFLAVVNISWLQERSAPGLTGRVMSLAMFSAIALDPISYVLAGLLVELSLSIVFLAAGGLLLFTALVGAMSRTMRTVD